MELTALGERIGFDGAGLTRASVIGLTLRRPETSEADMALALKSPAFGNGKPIPPKYTADGGQRVAAAGMVGPSTRNKELRDSR
jgi:hypothetical protein